MIDASWLKDAAPQTWLAYGRGWRLPVQAWNQDMGGLVVKGVKGRTGAPDPRSFLYLIRHHPDLRYLRCWQEALKKSMDAVASVSDGDSWLVELDVIGQVAVPRLNEPDIEKLVLWNPEEQWAVDEEDLLGANHEEMQESLRMRRFLVGFVDMAGLCGFENFRELELFYHALVGYMRVCLMSDRVAPLGFATLFASPLACNWHERTPCKIIRNVKQWQYLVAAQRPLYRLAKDPNCPKWVQKWRVELLENKPWRIISARQETERAILLGEYGYIFQNKQRLDAVLPLVDLVHRQWRQDTRAPVLGKALTDFTRVRVSKNTGKIKRRKPGSAAGGHHPNAAKYHFRKPTAKKPVVRKPPVLKLTPDLTPRQRMDMFKRIQAEKAKKEHEAQTTAQVAEAPR